MTHTKGRFNMSLLKPVAKIEFDQEKYEKNIKENDWTHVENEKGEDKHADSANASASGKVGN